MVLAARALQGWAKLPGMEPSEDNMKTNSAAVTIQLQRETLTVPALRVEGGLALHKDAARPAFWTITHVPSGFSVWERCARAKADAMVRFDALLSLTDWDRPQQELVKEDGLHARVMDLRENPPSAPRPERTPRPPRRMAKRTRRNGEEFETPVWWEEEGLTVEGDPEEGLTITHEPSGLRVVSLPRRVSRARASRIAKAFLDLGKKHGMDWTQRNPFPSSGAPQELRRMVHDVEQAT